MSAAPGDACDETHWRAARILRAIGHDDLADQLIEKGMVRMPRLPDPRDAGPLPDTTEATCHPDQYQHAGPFERAPGTDSAEQCTACGWVMTK